MEPLHVVVGARESVADAAARLRARMASAAPVMSAGRPIGLITRAQAENALRHGLGDARSGDLVCGGAPRVGAAADLPAMKRAILGTAPGLIVRGGPAAGAGGGVPRVPGAVRVRIKGVVTRHRLDEAVERHLGAFPAPAGRAGRDLGARLDALLGPERTAILKRAGGFAGAQGIGLLLAGGVVRDLLLGKPSKDLDLVVVGDGVMFAEELATILGARVTRHETFGTAAITLPDGGRIDIASARRETYDTPSMLPRVMPGSMLEDLHRRDITINSMAIHLDGSLYGRLLDDLGGERDLRARLLRVNHMLSLTEDPTRAFRIARLGGRLGFTAAPETLGSLALARRAGAFEALTGERLFKEFGLLACEESPVEALKQCARLGLLGELGPGVEWSAATARACARISGGLRADLFGRQPFAAPADRALLFLVLLSLRARPAQREALARRLRISGAGADRLAGSGAAAAALNRSLSGAARPSRIVDRCESVEADVLAVAWTTAPASARKAYEMYFGRLRAVRPGVSGETLRAMGVPPGPEYGAILAQLRRARLDGRVADDDAERRLAAALARRVSGAGRPGRRGGRRRR